MASLDGRYRHYNIFPHRTPSLLPSRSGIKEDRENGHSGGCTQESGLDAVSPPLNCNPPLMTCMLDSRERRMLLRLISPKRCFQHCVYRRKRCRASFATDSVQGGGGTAELNTKTELDAIDCVASAAISLMIERRLERLAEGFPAEEGNSCHCVPFSIVSGLTGGKVDSVITCFLWVQSQQ